jgi:hypothetical protein
MADFETPDHEAVDASFETPDHEAVPDEGALAAAGRGALRNFPGAQQLAAAAAPINPFSDKQDYSSEMEHLTQAAETAKGQHPVAYGAGATAGTLAPLAIPGVGEGLEAAPFLGNAALGAAQAASDVNLTKPTAADAAQVGGNALLAGGMGKAFSGLGKLFAKGAEPAAEAGEEAAAPIAEEAVPKAAPVAPAAPSATPPKDIAGVAVPSKVTAPNFRPSAQRVYASQLAQGLGGTPRQLMKVFGKENPVQALNNLGEWMDTAGPGGKSLHGLLDRPGELLSKISTIHETSGQTIGDIIDKVGASSPPAAVLGHPLVEGGELAEELKDFALNTADPATEARILKLGKTLDHLGTQNVTDFEALQQIKEMAGKQIAKDPEMAQVYGSLADRMNKLVDSYGQSINNPELKAVYDKAKLDYHNSSRILPMLRYVEGRELVGGPAGHFSLRGLLSTIVNVASMGQVPPVEQIGKNIALKTAPAVRAMANTRPTFTAPKGAGGATAQALSNFLTSKYGKEKR